MKGKNKPRASGKKRNDTLLAARLAEKKAKRREKKHALKLLQKKSHRRHQGV
jgi:hypothetical protein